MAQTWTTRPYDGPNHLGFWLNAALATNHEVVSLDVGENSVTKRGARALAAAFSSVCPKLSTLNVDGNSRLGHKGVLALARALHARDDGRKHSGGNTAHGNLSLDFGATNAGVGGAAAVAAELLRPGGSRVEYLNMEDNAFGAEGWRALSAALRGGGGVGLETLILYGNESGGDELTTDLVWSEFTTAVGLCPKLTNLDLGSTGMPTAAAEALAAVVGRKTCRVASLSLEGNPAIGMAGHIALAGAVARNTRMVELRVDDPTADDYSESELAAQVGRFASRFAGSPSPSLLKRLLNGEVGAGRAVGLCARAQPGAAGPARRALGKPGGGRHRDAGGGEGAEGVVRHRGCGDRRGGGRAAARARDEGEEQG